ncbi:uncharacterized protein SOCEGT47_066170 [Sorangium cellulosum]|uniref:Uncharacterized protein n=1 Tax=Sorangium cellulosum TaxID=56 RepID=A0A4P2Q8Y6_SORCE|nr:uncharacterized protein SOCEGT47_066170 [Sorangium cellulosum]
MPPAPVSVRAGEDDTRPRNHNLSWGPIGEPPYLAPRRPRVRPWFREDHGGPEETLCAVRRGEGRCPGPLALASGAAGARGLRQVRQGPRAARRPGSPRARQLGKTSCATSAWAARYRRRRAAGRAGVPLWQSAIGAARGGHARERAGRSAPASVALDGAWAPRSHAASPPDPEASTPARPSERGRPRRMRRSCTTRRARACLQEDPLEVAGRRRGDRSAGRGTAPTAPGDKHGLCHHGSARSISRLVEEMKGPRAINPPRRTGSDRLGACPLGVTLVAESVRWSCVR